MKGRYLKRAGGLLFAALIFAGALFVAPVTTQAQHRRRVVIIRPRIYRPFGWGYYPWGYYPGYPYGSYYSQYVFDDDQSAVDQGYKDGFKTGKDDGKKDKSYKPQRSHYYHDSGFGNFAEVYRSGFSRGYQEGYRVGQNSRVG